MRSTVLTNTREAVIEHLESLDNDELVAIHNQYCDTESYMDDFIYSNDENFFEEEFSGEVMKAVRAVTFGDYRYHDDYVQFNGYANLESFNSPDKYVDIPSIAESILEHPSDYDIELEDEEDSEEETTEDDE
jgi:hypothetical protein